MTRFHVDMTVVCPSDWDDKSVRRWLEDNILTTQEERGSLIVTRMEEPEQSR